MIDRILALEVGEVSEPFDSEIGVQLVQRTPISTRERFAVTLERFAFEPQAAPDGEGGSEVARKLATDWLERGDTQATRPGFREEWSSGRGPFGLEEAIRQVEPGEPLPKPVRSDFTFIAATREQPRNKTPLLLGRLGLPPSEMLAPSETP